VVASESSRSVPARDGRETELAFTYKLEHGDGNGHGPEGEESRACRGTG
jgi:hypothetical protein